jgi:glycine cleavage system H protein
MTDTQNLIKDWALTGVFVVLALVLLPLVAVFLFLGRMVFLVAALGILAAGVFLYLLSPNFRAWFDDQTASEISYKGLRLARNVAFHRSHCWAKVQPDEVVVGADDFVQSVLGPVERVEMPAAGFQVQRGEPLLRLSRGERSIDLVAPVTGTVVKNNFALRSRPELINEKPFSDGWAVRIRPDKPYRERRLLLRGTKAQAWFRKEVDRLIAALVPTETGVPNLADGGALVEGLYAHIDDETWKRLKESFWADERTNDLPV